MDIDAERAQRIFQAIVTQALIDATAVDQEFDRAPPRQRRREDDITHARRSKDQKAVRFLRANRLRTEARAWLLDGGCDFDLIVTLAGYNPVDIRERSRRLAEDGWPGKALRLAA